MDCCNTFIRYPMSTFWWAMLTSMETYCPSIMTIIITKLFQQPIHCLGFLYKKRAKEVEETIEGMLLRLEEFCSLADMIRSDTSQILEESIPLLKAKVTEMRGVYAKVDQLEAFVRMVAHHVSFLEAHVLQAERDHRPFSQTLRRWLGSTGLPSFRNKPSAPVPVFELPALYRTEDYFPVDAGEAALQAPRCPRRL
uniref:Par-6 family cell polarity regulator beta n=1 Tax=Equus asinus asinus TaxID=83772 RepID=A0A8C4NA68_EQUAS